VPKASTRWLDQPLFPDDILSKAQFEELMASSGISNDTTVVIYLCTIRF